MDKVFWGKKKRDDFQVLSWNCPRMNRRMLGSGLWDPQAPSSMALHGTDLDEGTKSPVTHSRVTLSNPSLGVCRTLPVTAAKCTDWVHPQSESPIVLGFPFSRLCP